VALSIVLPFLCNMSFAWLNGAGARFVIPTRSHIVLACVVVAGG
jgi:hypothetical protein